MKMKPRVAIIVALIFLVGCLSVSQTRNSRLFSGSGDDKSTAELDAQVNSMVSRAAPPADEQQEPIRSLSLYEKYPDVKMPSVVIVGNQKCGSTTLVDWMRQHPRVAGGMKEIFYFDKHKLTEEKYVENFPDCHKVDCNGLISLDASITYAFSPSSGNDILRALPGVKLIFMVRNPVERAYSKFRMNLRDIKGQNWGTFAEAVRRDLPKVKLFLKEYETSRLSENETVWQYQERLWASRLDPRWYNNQYLSGSIYNYIVQQFVQLFPRENILVVGTRELNRNPEIVMDQVFKFLGLDRIDIEFSKSNVFPANEDMDAEIKEMLTQFFAPYNQMFNDMMGTDFDLELPS